MGGMAPLTALLSYTYQELIVVWHMGCRGEKQGEEWNWFFRSGMVETPEETGAPVSTDLAPVDVPLVHGKERA